jgi:hypothetical protein
VLLPENWLSRMKDGPGPQVGVVTTLGSTFRDELSLIADRAPTNETDSSSKSTPASGTLFA